MGIRGKLLGGNSKVLPGAISATANDSLGFLDSDDDTSAGSKTPSSDTRRSSSSVSTRPNSSRSSTFPTPRGSTPKGVTPRGFSQRRRPVIDLSSPTSSDSRRSAWDTPGPASPWTRAVPFERKKSHARNDLSHLIAPVQPWNDFIEAYAKNLVEKVGGTQKAWTDVMSLNSGDVRTALYVNGITQRNANKPRPLPQEISKVIQALLESLPPAFRNDSARLTFALHERPFYCSALEKHVELVLWGIVSARNEWM